jgi:hypothetical protein
MVAIAQEDAVVGRVGAAVRAADDVMDLVNGNRLLGRRFAKRGVAGAVSSDPNGRPGDAH